MFRTTRIPVSIALTSCLGLLLSAGSTALAAPADPPAAQIVDDLSAGRLHWVTFTSPSTARNFAAMFDTGMLSTIAANTRFASIGPVTSAAMEEFGLPVAAEAEVHNVAGLIRAIVDATG